MALYFKSRQSACHQITINDAGRNATFEVEDDSHLEGRKQKRSTVVDKLIGIQECRMQIGGGWLAGALTRR